jgi:hypothetical protein
MPLSGTARRLGYEEAVFSGIRGVAIVVEGGWYLLRRTTAV